jgi:hypothetical protein
MFKAIMEFFLREEYHEKAHTILSRLTPSASAALLATLLAALPGILSSSLDAVRTAFYTHWEMLSTLSGSLDHGFGRHAES